MKIEKQYFDRKNPCLDGFDYNQGGAYFITICINNRKQILSRIIVGTPVPTDVNFRMDNKNSAIAKFVSTFKRFCNKEYGENIWQPRFYDHIIRNEKDYLEIWEYIENNPYKLIESR